MGDDYNDEDFMSYIQTHSHEDLTPADPGTRRGRTWPADGKTDGCTKFAIAVGALAIIAVIAFMFSLSPYFGIIAVIGIAFWLLRERLRFR